MDEAQKTVQKATYESSPSKNIWMTFVLMGPALILTGMFHQIVQFSLPKDFDLRYPYFRITAWYRLDGGAGLCGRSNGATPV